MNAYKCWADDIGYIIITAETRGKARAQYVSDVDGDYTMPMHIQLIERDIECQYAEDYCRSRYYDLMFAGIINPGWYEWMML